MSPRKTSLRIGDGVTLPLSIVTETLAMLAKRGMGKSNAAVVLAEEMWAAGQQWVAIDPKGDWWGIRSSADGKGAGLPVPIFGGRRGDVPLEASAGAVMARLVVERDLTCVLDVSLFSKGDQIRFVTDFAETLFRAIGDAPRPLHLYLEEAEEFLPQRVDARTARMVGAYSKISKQGRTLGLGVTLITQRSASLNKDALSQTDTLVLFRTVSPHDRKAVVAWAEHHDEAKDVAQSLSELEPGESWIVSPGFLGRVERVKWRRRETFDSGATPVAERRRLRAPVSLAEIDLGEITDLIAGTVERAKANDPAELKRRVAKLTRDLAAAQSATPPPPPEPVAVEVPVPVVTEAMLDGLREVVRQLGEQGELLRAGLEAAFKEQGDKVAEILAAVEQAAGRAGEARRSLVRAAAQPAPTRRPAPVVNMPRPPVSAAPPNGNGDVALKAGARRILATLARHHPLRHTRAQLGTLSKFTITGGTFQTYMSTLRRAGFVDESGGNIGITDAGLDYIGVAPAAPASTEELLAMWRSALRAGARAILDKLVEVYPDGIDRETLAEQVEMTASGGTFQTYVSTLKRNGLAVVNGSTVTASDALFLDGTR
jgi:hypothetical protein